jgi:hypothetical protein
MPLPRPRASLSPASAQMRYNKYLLAVLTFVTKCVGLDVSDLEEAVEQQGVSLVVYGTPVVPSKVTSDIVAALGGTDDDGGPSPSAIFNKASSGVAPVRARSARLGAKHAAAAAAAAAAAGGGGGEGDGSAARSGDEGGQGETAADPLTPTEAVDTFAASLTHGVGASVVAGG